MASAKIAKVKKQTPKKAVETEAEDGKKLNDYEILTTIGKIDNDHLLSSIGYHNLLKRNGPKRTYEIPKRTSVGTITDFYGYRNGLQ